MILMFSGPLTAFSHSICPLQVATIMAGTGFLGQMGKWQLEKERALGMTQ